MIVDTDGVPIEFFFTPGSTSDASVLQLFNMNLPHASKLLADRAHTNSSFEDMLFKFKKISLVAKRKSNHKRQHCIETNNLIKKYRNRIETVFSSIISRMPR